MTQKNLGFVSKLHIVDETLHADLDLTEEGDAILKDGRYAIGCGVRRDGVLELTSVHLSATPGLMGMAKSPADVPICCVRRYTWGSVTMDDLLSMVSAFSRWKSDGYQPPVTDGLEGCA